MINVAVLGYGVVGSGVVEVIEQHVDQIAHKVRREMHVKYILDIRDFPDSPYWDRFVKDFSVIESDPDVQVVVETIGGCGIAYELSRRALAAGKSVVTSNKELVAEHGYELQQMAREKNVSYLFEASVGGGIPILRPINQCLAANELTEVTGILNGTTNYILTRMFESGISFEEALAEAQKNGYAERDPSADVDGHDACRKICILSTLAFGRHVYPRQVHTEGIRGITEADVRFAAAIGKKIKLLGRTIRGEDGKVRAYVAPHLIDAGCPLATVQDVFNGIMVKGDAIGDVMFYGRGAGKLPTASAVVADVIDAAQHIGQRKYIDWAEGGDDVTAPDTELSMYWYLRVSEEPAGLAGLLTPIACEGAPEGEKAYLTAQPLTRTELEERLAGAAVLSCIRLL